MEKANTVLLVMLIGLGLAGMALDMEAFLPSFYLSYKTAIELYLFVFSAFLVLKRVFFYRLRDQVEVVRLKQRSEKQNLLLWYGAILTLFYLTYLWRNDNLYSANMVMISLLLLYYSGQILSNSNPSIYVDARAFSFDDYFVQNWPWQQLRQIVVDQKKLKIEGQHKDFELDFDAIDGMDYVKLSREVEASVLDGDLIDDNSSKMLLEVIEAHARNYNVRLQTS
ncbi:MAG: hypothetical protein AAFW73_16220 [Bacteroidota bacterium]